MTRPGMADGRCFTSYEPNCKLNKDYMNKKQITTNNEYRRFLQQNSEYIMKHNLQVCESNSKNECQYCIDTGR